MKKIMILSMVLFLGNLSFSLKSLDFDSINGTGKFVNAKGGTMGNQNNQGFSDVKGRVYVSGDFGENDYSNKITTASILKTNNFHGKVISDSPMYSVNEAYDQSTNELKFTLTRIKFTSGLIEDDNLGNYLEDNYYDSNNYAKNSFYNGLKNIDSN